MDYAMPPPKPEPVTTIAWRLAHLIVVFASTKRHTLMARLHLWHGGRDGL